MINIYEIFEKPMIKILALWKLKELKLIINF